MTSNEFAKVMCNTPTCELRTFKVRTEIKQCLGCGETLISAYGLYSDLFGSLFNSPFG